MADDMFLCTLCFVAVIYWSRVDCLMPYENIDSVEEYKLPELPYGYSDLEPIIDEATVRVHHQGHHAAYTNKLNAALKQWHDDEIDSATPSMSIMALLINIDKVPKKYKTAIQNNGGGFVNHNFYWSVMSFNPTRKERLPTGKLMIDISKEFGNFSRFKDLFTQQALQLFGSGYVWLSRRPKDQTLVLSTTTNQNCPLSDGLHPILVLDVWEHAYYLKHQNKRQNHVTDWWYLVDWEEVEKLDSWYNRIKHAQDEL